MRITFIKYLRRNIKRETNITLRITYLKRFIKQRKIYITLYTMYITNNFVWNW